uniref:RBR-type E3 ubiquitin transferase n=1 Tax=Dracunculus medinensis TaxID=318479 RepID=A0A0N4UJN6_DRAME
LVVNAFKICFDYSDPGLDAAFVVFGAFHRKAWQILPFSIENLSNNKLCLISNKTISLYLIVLYRLDRKNRKCCPKITCHAVIEKQAGCNHMLCCICNTHFCWLCGKKLFEYLSIYSSRYLLNCRAIMQMLYIRVWLIAI